MRICRHEEFECAHLLPDYPGKCGNLHGHSYKIEVTIEGNQQVDKWGMVMDFNELKSIINSIVPDHCFIYNKKQPSRFEIDLLKVLKDYDSNVRGYPFDTTAENMCSYFAEQIELEMQKRGYDFVVAELKLWETTNSYAHFIR